MLPEVFTREFEEDIVEMGCGTFWIPAMDRLKHAGEQVTPQLQLREVYVGAFSSHRCSALKPDSEPVLMASPHDGSYREAQHVFCPSADG